MDPTPSFHRRPPSSSSDRLLAAFTFFPSSAPTPADELNEADLFWSESENQTPPYPPPDLNRRRNFDRALESGILAALTEPDLPGKPSVSSSSSRMIPNSLRRPPPAAPISSDYLAQSAPSRKFQQQSAPMKVPILLSKGAPRRRNFDELAFVDDDDDAGADEEMLPPHELVARGSGVSPKTTFSVLEGVGRTLKGRDLRQVRNAVLRRTGFLD